jgi:hypothetical protein
VVFISNEAGACAMWHQRAAVRPSWPILWDYHVILLVADPWEVWDLDTTLDFPVPAQLYLRKSFRTDLPEEYLPRFRAVEAGAFLATFASDRSHMLFPDGRWRKPPPPWPAIGAPGAASNLMRFVDMRDPFVGELLDLRGMLAKISDA